MKLAINFFQSAPVTIEFENVDECVDYIETLSTFNVVKSIATEKIK